jgi:hypothetical protein
VEGPVARLAVARCILRAVSTLVEGAVAVLLEGAITARGERTLAALLGTLCVAGACGAFGALFRALSGPWCVAMLGPVAAIARPVGTEWLGAMRLVPAIGLGRTKLAISRARLDRDLRLRSLGCHVSQDLVTRIVALAVRLGVAVLL